MKDTIETNRRPDIMRLERDNKHMIFMLRYNEKKIQKLKVKARRNLETIEKYLTEKIEQVKSDCNVNRFVAEMEYLLKTVKEEKVIMNSTSVTRKDREDEKDIS